MTRSIQALLLGLAFVSVACAKDDESGEIPSGCTPGSQLTCACPGGLEGTQVCNPDGKSFGACNGCPGAGGSTNVGGGGGFPSGGGTGGSSGGAGGTSAGGGSGGSGATGGSAPKYTSADCLVTAENDGEECDDNVFDVPSPGKPIVLVCLNAGGGTIYVSKNTGPVMSDGIPRCQGWETNGQKAWDNLQYIEKIVCDADQKLIDVDLGTYVGQTLYGGAHDAPTGGGHNTTMCAAWKK